MLCQLLLSCGCALTDTDLEASVIFGDFVCKFDLLSLAQELPQLRPVVHAQVVAHKVPVETVPSPLLPVQQQVGSWRHAGRRQRERVRSWDGGMGGMARTHRTLLHSPSSLIWTYFLRATYFLQAFWMVLA